MKFNFVKELIEAIPRHLASALLGAIGLAILGLWSIFQTALVRYLLPLQSSTISGMGWTIALLSSLLIVGITYILYLHSTSKPKTFYACGVLWDGQFNPLCPSCGKPLGNYAFYLTRNRKSRPGCKCFSCDIVVRFSDEEKIFMTLEEAKERARLLFSDNKN